MPHGSQTNALRYLRHAAGHSEPATAIDTQSLWISRQRRRTEKRTVRTDYNLVPSVFTTRMVYLAVLTLAALLSAAYLAWYVQSLPRVRPATPIRRSCTSLPALIRRRQLGVPLVLLTTGITILHLWLV
jgi:hypothetical protein